MAYRHAHAFESIFRQRRDQNHIANLREGPFGYVPQPPKAPTRADGYRTVKVQAPKASALPKSSCGSRPFVCSI